jgi:hypothetical protein
MTTTTIPHKDPLTIEMSWSQRYIAIEGDRISLYLAFRTNRQSTSPWFINNSEGPKARDYWFGKIHFMLDIDWVKS